MAAAETASAARREIRETKRGSTVRRMGSLLQVCCDTVRVATPSKGAVSRRKSGSSVASRRPSTWSRSPLIWRRITTDWIAPQRRAAASAIGNAHEATSVHKLAADVEARFAPGLRLGDIIAVLPSLHDVEGVRHVP